MYNISMKKIFIGFTFSLFLVFSFSFTSSVFAQFNGATRQVCTGTMSDCIQGNESNALGLNLKLKNPLKVQTIQEAIKLLVEAVVRIAIPILVIFYIWAGLEFIFARGKPEKLEKAKRMFFYTIIGTLLILGAWTITNIVVGTVNTIVS